MARRVFIVYTNQSVESLEGSALRLRILTSEELENLALSFS